MRCLWGAGWSSWGCVGWGGGCSAVPASKVGGVQEVFPGLGCGFTGAGLTGDAPSAPAEGHVSRAVAPLLHQWLVKLSAGPRVDAGPAVLAVVLQAGDVGTEEGGELPPAACPLALVTHLVVQDIRLHLHLWRRRTRGGL